MNCCQKCGEMLEENTKFCSKCGSQVKNDYKDSSTKKKSKKPLLYIAAFLCICAMGGAAYFKTYYNVENKKKSIDIVSLDITSYPNIAITIKANNYEEVLDVNNLTLKENDSFQKNLNIENTETSDQYVVTYKTSDENSVTERKISLAYLENNNEILVDVNYTAPEKEVNVGKSKNSDSNNSVNTYDNNELDIKNAIDRYENAFIQMVNYKNPDYIKNSIDLSGQLFNEFTNLVKSYEGQWISESLINHKIESIHKVSDIEYEATVTEKYRIHYGKKNENKISDFRTTYVLKKIGSDFKISYIKNIDNL